MAVLWVYDRDTFEATGVIPDADSLIFERSFAGVGAVQVRISALRPNAKLLKPGAIIRLDGRADMAAIITGRSISIERGRQMLTALGEQLKGVLRRRVIVPPTATEDAAAYGWDRVATSAGEAVLRHYVDRHAVTPTDANRAIGALEMEAAPAVMRGTETPWQARWAVLTDELRDICEWCGLGYNIDLDVTGQRWVYKTLQGADLTGRSGGLTRVTMSPVFSNVTNVQYHEDYGASSNSIYALGAGEDEDQIVRLLYADELGGKLETAQTGVGRTETTISVGPLSLPDEVDYEAYHSLKASIRQVRTLSATINNHGPFRYRRDWDLGDTVAVRLTLKEMAETIVMYAPVTAITEVYERDGLSPRLDVVFGSAQPTLAQTVDRRIHRR